MERIGRIIPGLCAILFIVYMLSTNCNGTTNNEPTIKMETFYGTYKYHHDPFDYEIRLLPDSYNEYKKWASFIGWDGNDYSRHWVLYEEGYIKVMDTGATNVVREVIDFNEKKVYESWGEFLDGENGYPYTFTPRR